MRREVQLLTVTPNASLDVLLQVPAFTVGAIQRAAKVQAVAGGKGLNVARFANTIGHAVAATGFVAGFTGQRLVNELDAQGISADFVRIPGESRACYTIIDPERDTETEIRELGPPLGAEHADSLVATVTRWLPRTRSIACCGSLPPGANPDVYARIIAAARAAGRVIVLDSSGEALARGLHAGPTIVKPNQAEFEDVTGEPLPAALVEASVGSDDDRLDRALLAFEEFCRPWFAYGIELVVVSLGAAGAVAARDGETLRVWPPKVEVGSSVSCGDALVAGLATGYGPGCDLVAVARYATGLAAAAARHTAPGIVDAADVAELVARTVVSVRRACAGGVRRTPASADPEIEVADAESSDHEPDDVNPQRGSERNDHG